MLNFTKEIIEQKINDLKEKLKEVHHSFDFQRRNELTFISEKRYSVEQECSETIKYSRDIASGKEFYKKQL